MENYALSEKTNHTNRGNYSLALIPNLSLSKKNEQILRENIHRFLRMNSNRKMMEVEIMRRTSEFSYMP